MVLVTPILTNVFLSRLTRLMPGISSIKDTVKQLLNHSSLLSGPQIVERINMTTIDTILLINSTLLSELLNMEL